ncbi:MAG: N-6 DNA methylase [Candidatus Zixiibacteriota bacterium]|nr:MAG: N-6 DNA methylase [candidate division Zixibacteria bacterium]
MTDQFNNVTKRYLEQTDLTHRKALGQYFTPRKLRNLLLSKLPRKRDALVLDPACGSGEFLLSADEYFPGCKLHGWEIDARLARLSRKTVPQATIRQVDSLKKDPQARFDFVIGNPPYFEFKPDYWLKYKFRDVISGRTNIFSMFVKLGLQLLKPKGYLAYVISPSMNNGAYFTRLREYIIDHANIEYLSIQQSSSLFHSAQQTVMVMVLKKGRNKGDYVFSKNGLTIFSPDKEDLEKAFAGKTTLREMGFTVRTGKIVWNQHREQLTDDSLGSVPLIWAHNIAGSELVVGNHQGKPQYIKTDRYDTGPAVVVNRITGAADRVSLKAALIDPGFRFLGENHVNVIYPPEGMATKRQQQLLRSVRDCINTDQTARTMKLVTGNTQISRTELERLLPLDIRNG